MSDKPKFNLQLFADAGTFVNTTKQRVNAYTGEVTPFTPDSSLSVGNKTFYDTALLVNARDEQVYDQFGETQNIPPHSGKTVEFRKNDLIDPPKQLIEGVIPPGSRFGQTAVTATVAEFGLYVALSEDVKINQIDDIALGALEEVGAAMGKKMDSLTRDALLEQATNVIFPATVNASGTVTNQPTTIYEIDAANRITADTIHKVSTQLTKGKGKKINGAYVGIIHPSITYDLRSDPQWIEAHKYAKPDEIYTGEIGMLHGVRFIETTNAPVMVGESLYTDAQRWLTASGAGSTATPGTAVTYGVTGAYAIPVTETLASATANYERLIGQNILIYSGASVIAKVEVTGVDVAGKKIHTEALPTGVAVAQNNTLVPGNGGNEGAKPTDQLAVYGSIFLSQGAFKRIKVAGGEMRTIIKSAAEAGGPLEQFSTVGAKGKHGAKVVYPERMVVVYSASEYSHTDAGNWEQ